MNAYADTTGALPFDERAAAVVEALESAGYEACLVGGCVRDALLGRRLHDYDIATSARPEQILSACSAWRCIPTGLAHGTVTVVADGLPVEVTTYRADGPYSDGRHPDHVLFADDLRSDLERRDFTVNAMAWHPKKGLLDLLDARADLNAALLRAVGDPDRRFAEDALRILRGIRLSSELSFDLEPGTCAAMIRRADGLAAVSAERITAELSRALTADDCRIGSGIPIWKKLFPELFAGSDAARERWLEAKPWPGWRELLRDTACRYAAFFIILQLDGAPDATFADCSRAADACLSRLRLAGRDEQAVRHILQVFVALETTRQQLHAAVRSGAPAVEGAAAVGTADPAADADPAAAAELSADRLPVSPDEPRRLARYTVRSLMADHGRVAFMSALSIMRLFVNEAVPHRLAGLEPRNLNKRYRILLDSAEAVLAASLPISMDELAIGGADLIAAGIPEGPALGQLLRGLFHDVMAEALPNEREALLTAALQRQE